MNLERVEEIANAVLYEGYLLYPYRASAVKNRQRFNFGVLCPPACAEQQSSERFLMQTECLCRVTRSTQITIRVKFLQIVQRSIARYATGQGADESQYVDHLEVDGHHYQPWQEAVERSITYDGLNPEELRVPRNLEFKIPAEDSREDLRAMGERLGAIVRQSQPLDGTVHLHALPCRDDIVKLTVRVENQSAFSASEASPSRDEALLLSLVSAHVILGIEDGEFLSLLDPPSELQDLARECQNIGNWPVLAAEDGTTMLASPIILYDNPKIAPESAGNLFDSTEIDEILSLRILTLTDVEKAEIRQTDDRARELLERTENIPEEQFMKLHGALRGLTAHKEELE